MFKTTEKENMIKINLVKNIEDMFDAFDFKLKCLIQKVQNNKECVDNQNYILEMHKENFNIYLQRDQIDFEYQFRHSITTFKQNMKFMLKTQWKNAKNKRLDLTYMNYFVIKNDNLGFQLDLNNREDQHSFQVNLRHQHKNVYQQINYNSDQKQLMYQISNLNKLFAYRFEYRHYFALNKQFMIQNYIGKKVNKTVDVSAKLKDLDILELALQYKYSQVTQIIIMAKQDFDKQKQRYGFMLKFNI